MAYEYRDRYDRRDSGPQGIGAKPILIVGLVLLFAGAIVVVHALHGSIRLPPAAAQQIPASVQTTSPLSPNPQTVAAPMAPSAPAQIEIPSIGVRAPIMQVGLNSDGTVQVPPVDNHNLAAWYRGSAPPGADGSAIILGHVDTYAGPSVFYSIKTLRRGDPVDVVRADGTIAVFVVDGVQSAAKSNFPTSSVYDNVPYPALRLITCGGPFDAAKGSYVDNIVVYAHLAGYAAS